MDSVVQCVLVLTHCVILPGNVPGPLLFGFVFDKACAVWREQCDDRGSCWIYDGEKLSVNLTILGVVVRAFSILFFCTFIHREQIKSAHFSVFLMHSFVKE